MHVDRVTESVVLPPKPDLKHVGVQAGQRVSDVQNRPETGTCTEEAVESN